MKRKIGSAIISFAALAGAGVSLSSGASAGMNPDSPQIYHHSPYVNFAKKADCQAKATAYDTMLKSKGYSLGSFGVGSEESGYSGPTKCELNDEGWTYVTNYYKPGTSWADGRDYSVNSDSKPGKWFGSAAEDWGYSHNYTNFMHAYGGFPTKAACDSAYSGVLNKIKANPDVADVMYWDSYSKWGSMACYKESGKNTYRYQVIYRGKWLNNLYDYEQFQHFFASGDISTPDSAHLNSYSGKFGTMLPNKVVQYSQYAIFPLALA